MTTPAAPDSVETAATAEPSPGKKVRRAAGSKSKRSESETVSEKRPPTLEEARKEMLRLVCLHAKAMTRAVIKDALEGRYLSAKFLFEAVGLCVEKDEELEESEGRESLARLLLQRWHLAGKSLGVTEVQGVTGEVARVSDGPVEL